MKQETLEEVAKIICHTHKTPLEQANEIVKLLQERSYSEEDMKFAYEQGARLALISQSSLALHKGKFTNPDKWFEQFKKQQNATRQFS